MRNFTSSLFGIDLPDPVALYQDDNCQISQLADFRELRITKNWHPSIENIAMKFEVNRLVLNGTFGWDGDSIEFLDRLPAVQRFHISPKLSLDWTPLERHPNIVHLSVWITLPVYPPHYVVQGPLDFRKLPQLRVCSIPWLPEWDSIRQCQSVESLKISAAWKLRALDLSEMHGLRELAIESCPDLQQLLIANETNLVCLKISQCRKLKLDLKRFVRNLDFLWFEGKLAFALDDLGEAVHLRFLILTFLNNKVPIPSVLHKLIALEDVTIAGARLSEPDERIFQSFVAKKRERTIRIGSGT